MKTVVFDGLQINCFGLRRTHQSPYRGTQKPAKYSELFTNEDDSADKWYKVKCNFITLDEKTQTEKKTAQNMLVQAANFRGALERFEEGMKGTLADYEIAAIQETNLMDVFPFEAKD